MNQEQFQKACDLSNRIDDERIHINRLTELVENAEANGVDARYKFSILFNGDGQYLINQEPDLTDEIFTAAKELIKKHIDKHILKKIELETKFDDL